MQQELHLTVNGVPRRVRCEPDAPLLDVLRHDLGLAGPRFGCGVGLCGACFVLMAGQARSSCDFPAWAAEGTEVTTVEGLAAGGAPQTVAAPPTDRRALRSRRPKGAHARATQHLLQGRPRQGRARARAWAPTLRQATRHRRTGREPRGPARDPGARAAALRRRPKRYPPTRNKYHQGGDRLRLRSSSWEKRAVVSGTTLKSRKTTQTPSLSSRLLPN